MYVNERFRLDSKVQDNLRSLIPNFGYNGYGEFLFYRTYSRNICRHCKEGIKNNGVYDYCVNCGDACEPSNETWADTVTRVVNGVFSIRKDWYIKNRINWYEKYWQDIAKDFATSLYKMEWIPPGRGLWAMGTDFVYERGSMALYNCAYTDITSENMDDDLAWLMDSLMLGVGVGFGPVRDIWSFFNPKGSYDFVIPDTREGWVDSVRLHIASYIRPHQKKPRCIFDNIRGPGLPIRGFGGVSSGPQPLIDLHKYIDEEFARYGTRPEYDIVYLKTNLANRIGCCVVAGNVRRSAELSKGKMSDPTFMDLKDYTKFPEREAFGWMSNNSVELETDEDFESLGEIAKRVIRNGEPGFINRRNMVFARIGHRLKGLRKDKAVGFNPCGEIPLEHREVCNLVETLPTMCQSADDWFKACEFATLYCQTVSLLPTHQPSTNLVVARNRRIGVGLVDYTNWISANGVHKVIKYMRVGYDTVRRVAKSLAEEAGVPEPIRVTTVKPGGTTPKLPGKVSGAGYPTFGYTLRRTRVAKNSPVHPLLVKANIPYEQDVFDPYTDVFEWPIFQEGKPAEEVTLWQQAFNLITLQREWADNAVSNTLYFKPMWQLVEHINHNTTNILRKLESYIGMSGIKRIEESSNSEYIVPERYKIKIKRSNGQVVALDVYEYNPKHEENDIEPVLSAIAPLTKSVTVLPHSPKGAYAQMPEEGISKEEFSLRFKQMTSIDWSELIGSDGDADAEKYCQGDRCVLPGV